MPTYTNTSNIEVATPQTALRLIESADNHLGNDYINYNLVIAISYSGKTEEIKRIYETCLRYNLTFILITGANKEELQNFYKENELVKIISYYNASDNTGFEKSFVSLFSTLAPCILFYNLITYSLGTKIDNFITESIKISKSAIKCFPISKLGYCIKKCPIIHLFYDWNTYSVALDIESKFIESGIANVILHEKKNFAHGRATILYKQDFGLIINLVKYDDGGDYYGETFQTEYDFELSKYLKDLCKEKNSHYFEICETLGYDDMWNLRILFTIAYLTVALGEKLGIDISNPITPYPKETILLYNYKGIF